MSDVLEIVVICGIVGLVIVGLACGMIAFIANITFPGDVAQIESLRADAAKVNINAAEDVMGQVTEANQSIAANRAYNRIPFLCLMVPNGWDTIKPIDVPRR